MKETNKWSVRDVITTVLLSAVLIAIQLIVNMVCMANDFVSMVLSVGITMFLCGRSSLQRLYRSLSGNLKEHLLPYRIAYSSDDCACLFGCHTDPYLERAHDRFARQQLSAPSYGRPFRS